MDTYRSIAEEALDVMEQNIIGPVGREKMKKLRARLMDVVKGIPETPKSETHKEFERRMRNWNFTFGVNIPVERNVTLDTRRRWGFASEFAYETPQNLVAQRCEDIIRQIDKGTDESLKALIATPSGIRRRFRVMWEILLGDELDACRSRVTYRLPIEPSFPPPTHPHKHVGEL